MLTATRLEGGSRVAPGMPTAILAREGNVRIMLTPWKAERRGRNNVSGDITGLLDPGSPEAVNFVFF